MHLREIFDIHKLLKHKLLLGIMVMAIVMAITIPVMVNHHESKMETVSISTKVDILPPNNQIVDCGTISIWPEGDTATVPALTAKEIRDPEIAKKYGFQGYLDITSPVKVQETVEKGKVITIPILLHFVSYQDKPTSLVVTLDPIHSDLIMGQVYSVLDYQGNILAKRDIRINDLISYDITSLTLNNNETKQIMMSINMPEDIPEMSTLREIAFGPVGITTHLTLAQDAPVSLGNSTSDVAHLDSAQFKAIFSGDAFTIEPMEAQQ